MKQSKVIRKIAEFRIRLGRGQSLTYEVKTALMYATAIKVLLNTSLIITIILTIGVFLTFFILGFFDLRFLKLYQKEAELGTGKYNPYFKRKLG